MYILSPSQIAYTNAMDKERFSFADKYLSPQTRNLTINPLNQSRERAFSTENS
jgi:hypothetical protein